MDCRTRCTALPAAPPLRRCTANRFREIPWCAPPRPACRALGAEYREIAGACRPWEMRALSGAAQIFQQGIDGRSLGLHHPELADVAAKIVEQLRAPDAPRRIDMLFDQAPQVLHVSTHAFGRHAMDIDQVMVVAVDEIALHIENVG